MLGDARAHLAVAGLGGGDVGHRQAAFPCQALGQAALAGTGAAEDQFKHVDNLFKPMD
ncbi:hypothetical protein D3C86_2179850 [compost metagenome]